MAIPKRSKVDWVDRIGRRIKLRDLHIFMAVVQWGSMARAADRLAISQPVISKVVSDLEAVLGVRLLDRGRHGVEPTVYGLALLKRGGAAFGELRQGVKDIEFLLDATVGELRIAAADPIASGLIPAVIERLSKQYPKIIYHVTGGASLLLQQVENLRDYKIDLIVGRLPAKFMEPDLAVEVLCEEASVVAAAAHNPWVNRRKVRLSELIDEPWVLPSADSFVGALVAGLFHAHGLELPQRAVYCTSIQLNNALLASGRYLAFYPESILRLGGKRLGIKVLNLEQPAPTTPLGIITLKERTLPPIAQLFVESARAVSADY